MIELLTTKLLIPGSRKNLVPRPHLIEHLNAGSERKLTSIAPPTGLSEGILQNSCCMPRLSLDEIKWEFGLPVSAVR